MMTIQCRRDLACWTSVKFVDFAALNFVARTLGTCTRVATDGLIDVFWMRSVVIGVVVLSSHLRFLR